MREDVSEAVRLAVAAVPRGVAGGKVLRVLRVALAALSIKDGARKANLPYRRLQRVERGVGSLLTDVEVANLLVAYGAGETDVRRAVALLGRKD